MYRRIGDRQHLMSLRNLLQGRPDAVAAVRGSAEYPEINGNVLFYQTNAGVVIAAELRGLPAPTEPCAKPFFGFHLHSGGSCTGNEDDPFADAETHYNPDGCPHPHHAGDFPPLLGNHGEALALFLTDRFTVSEVLGKTVIVHAKPDDFTTQPGGDSGERIACGVVRAL